MQRIDRPSTKAEKNEGRTVQFIYDSWSDFVDCAESAPNMEGARVRASRRVSSKEWTPHDWDESIKLARSGWYGAESKIRVMVSEMTALNGSMAETVAFQMACEGEEYDVGALLEGRPECMYLPTSEITKGRNIYKIAVPTSGNGGLSAEAFIKQGSMVCAVVKAIEERGQTCEVSAHQVGINGTLAARFDIPLMSAGDSIDIPFLAFAVAHPSTLRRLMFAVMEGDPEWKAMGASAGGGFGRTHIIDLGGDIAVPGVEEVSRMSIPECAEWVRKTVEGVGQ